MDTEKGSIKLVEANTAAQRAMPECLQGLSQDELQALEKKLLRKVDARLLPTMIIIYIMNYLDRFVALSADGLDSLLILSCRNAIGAARLGGLEEDLNLGPNEFQVRGAIQYAGNRLAFLTPGSASRPASPSFSSVTSSCKSLPTCFSTKSAAQPRICRPAW